MKCDTFCRTTHISWKDNAIQIAWRSMVINRLCYLASERPHNWVIILLGSVVRFRYRTSFSHATILLVLSLTKQCTLCIISCNMSIASPNYMYARRYDLLGSHKSREDWVDCIKSSSQPSTAGCVFFFLKRNIKKKLLRVFTAVMQKSYRVQLTWMSSR